MSDETPETAGRADHAREGLALGAQDTLEVQRVRDERIDHIVDLMTRGAWYGARSHRELAATWGVSLHAVREYASTARSVVRAVLDDSERAEDVKAALLSAVDEVRRRASESGDDPRALAVALKALELRAKVLGALVDRHEVNVLGDLDRLSVDELEQLRALLLKAKGDDEK